MYQRQESKENILCNICGSDQSTIIYHNADSRGISKDTFMITKALLDKGEVSRCTQCGFVFDTTPQSDTSGYTDVVDEKYESHNKARSQELREAFTHLETHIPDGSIEKFNVLDVGCFTGVFLSEIQKTHGDRYNCFGIEPSKWASRMCANKQLNVRQGFFEDVTFPDEYFDIITMFDVLEHTADPKGFLLKAQTLLKKDGFLLITTPNIENIYHRIFKNRYWFIEKMHLVYFSPQTLSRLLNMSGFTVKVSKDYLKFLQFGYLIERLQSLSPLLGFLRPVSQIPGLSQKILKLNAGQILVIAKKN